MRLIDADALIEAMKKTESEYENAMTCPSWWSAFNVISEQSTAYDIDKVVEELEEIQDKAVSVKNEDISIYATGIMGKAIEIVNHGGVSDDVCEWVIVDRPHNLPIYNTSCGKIRLQYVTGVDIYCNGCGKKIKVVE